MSEEANLYNLLLKHHLEKEAKAMENMKRTSKGSDQNVKTMEIQEETNDQITDHL